MASENKDVLRVVDTLANVQANIRNKQISFETTNDRIVVKDAVGAFHYFSKDADINPTDITITDNIVDAFRVREDTNDYINVDTDNTTPIMYFGNATTNPEYRFLGTGRFGIGKTPAVYALEVAGTVQIDDGLRVDTNLFFCDHGTDRVAVGTLSPATDYGAYTFEVANTTGPGICVLTTSQADGAVVVGKLQGNYATNQAGQKDVAAITIVSAGSTANQRGGEVVIATKPDAVAAAIERLRVTHQGQVQMVNQSGITAAGLQIQQLDVDEPFIKFIGTAASADLTRSIVDVGDVTTPTIAGYAKVEVQDDGNQITDQDYFVQLYTIV